MTESRQLLAEYSKSGSEAAFRELVTRYINLVYSTALRLVDQDTQEAEDVTQTVFIDLARLSRNLSSDTMLGGWLHQHTFLVATKAVRTDRRRRAREREVAEMNMLHSEAGLSDATPLLDEAITQLPSEDRTAILLRFFEQRDFRSVGDALGTSEDAARMRVNRAVDKLHGLLKDRGVTVSAAALGAALTAEAVTAAPAGLAAAVSAAALSGATFTTTAIAATKAVAMTTLQKTAVTAVVAVAVGTGTYEAHQAANARAEVQTLHQQQSPLTEQIQHLQRERDEAARKLDLVREENERLNRNAGEVLRLRAAVTRLRNTAETSKTNNSDQLLDTSNPLWKPNWIVLRPLDLTKFPDSQIPISGKEAQDVGISSPAALLQTWIWAQRTGDSAGLLKTWDFPDGTTEDQKMEHVLSAQKGAEHYRAHPDTRAETCKLHDLFDIGNGYYLAFIEEQGLTTGTWIGHQYFRHVGEEWKVSFGRQTK